MDVEIMYTIFFIMFNTVGKNRRFVIDLIWIKMSINLHRDKVCNNV